MMRLANTSILASFAVLSAPCWAQSLPIDPDARQAEAQSQEEGLGEIARTADAGSGEIGQRQARDVAPNIEPLGRINNRIENRVQNRLRNRVDRNYDATANATAPFERAQSRTRTAVGRRPR